MKWLKSHVDEARIESAARAAFAHDFILDLPRRYDTMIGERGSRLSGGQRQRIAIARALLREPRLLVFDEPTQHLDARAVEHLLHGLKHSDEPLTILVITHDPEVIRAADFAYTLVDHRLQAVARPQPAWLSA
jgi:ABC-type bacteriocin/lantibiotic exporter with double-glycine peptidase domain